MPRFLVLMPVYDDWEAVRLLLPQLDEHFSVAGISADVLLVDDCSPHPGLPHLLPARLQAIERVDILSLARNLGHQRAIAVGLAHASEGGAAYRGIVVMDSDGQDQPADVLSLLETFDRYAGERLVFARRTKRSEGFLFALSYWLYRALHRALTGIRVEVGNFSILPSSLVTRLTMSAELWNHYAASAYQARVPTALVGIPRGTRIAGTSRMNFVSLVAHGLGAMAVFADRIGVRLLVATGVLAAVLAAGVTTAVAIRLFTDLAIPGWATTATGVLLILLVQAGMLGLVFAFLVQHSRTAHSFIPARDHAIFVKSVSRVTAVHA